MNILMSLVFLASLGVSDGRAQTEEERECDWNAQVCCTSGGRWKGKSRFVNDVAGVAYQANCSADRSARTVGVLSHTDYYCCWGDGSEDNFHGSMSIKAILVGANWRALSNYGCRRDQEYLMTASGSIFGIDFTSNCTDR